MSIQAPAESGKRGDVMSEQEKDQDAPDLAALRERVELIRSGKEELPTGLESRRDEDLESGIERGLGLFDNRPARLAAVNVLSNPLTASIAFEANQRETMLVISAMACTIRLLVEQRRRSAKRKKEFEEAKAGAVPCDA